MELLQSWVTPFATLHFVDDVIDVPSTPTSARVKSTPAPEYPFLPDDVHIVRVRTYLRNDTWDLHAIQVGHECHQRRAWVVNLNLGALHFSALQILDTFFRVAYSLAVPLSTLILTYATGSHSENQTRTRGKGQLKDVTSENGNDLRYYSINLFASDAAVLSAIIPYLVTKNQATLRNTQKVLKGVTPSPIEFVLLSLFMELQTISHHNVSSVCSCLQWNRGAQRHHCRKTIGKIRNLDTYGKSAKKTPGTRVSTVG